MRSLIFFSLGWFASYIASIQIPQLLKVDLNRLHGPTIGKYKINDL